MLIRDIMISPALSAPPSARLSAVADIMAEKRIGFIIIEENNTAIGVLTEGDLVNLLARAVAFDDEVVSDHMTSPVFSVPVDANAFYAYDELVARKMRHLVVEDAQGNLAGVVTMSCFIANLGVDHYTDLQTVAEIIHPIHVTVTPDTFVSDAIRLMDEHKHAMIAVEDGRAVGLFSSRDITRLCRQERSLDGLCMRDVMRKPVAIKRKAFVPEASVLMKVNHTRHLVVVGEAGEFTGLLTISDVAYSMEGKYVEFMRSVMRDMEHERISASRYRHALFERNPNAVFSLDLDGLITDVNPACILLTGHASEYLIAKSLVDFFDPDIAAEAETGFREALQGSARSQHLRLISGVGKLIYVFMTFVPVQVGEVTESIYAVAFDITERILAEQRLLKLSQALHQAGEPIAITDAYGVIEFTNRRLNKLFGYQEGALICQHLSLLEQAEPNASSYRDEVWKVVAEGLPYKGEFLHRRKDGEVLDLKISCAPVHVPGAEKVAYFIIIFEDMAERRRAENHAMQSQKMETIGTLAGGVAHDFNNYLAAVSGSLYMLKHEVAHLPNACERLTTLEKLTDRAASLVSQLLTYARKDTVDRKIIALSDLVEDTRELAYTLVPKGIALDWRIAKHISVNGSDTQIQQVLLNLISNARDAVRDALRPRIEIALASFEADQAFAERLGCHQADKYAELSVSDNGCGIPDECRAEIFDPFFTTKGVNEGTGMGLAMSIGAIESHHGLIDFDSEPGKGTTFRIYLPLQSALQQSVRAHDAGKPLILFADDDEVVREIGIEIIESFAYRVLAADNGEDALNLFQKDPGSFSMAVLDIMMPGMNGTDAAAAMRKIRPGFPVLFLTGYDQKLISTSLLAEPGIAMLQKPWKVEKIAPAIEALINASPESGQ